MEELSVSPHSKSRGLKTFSELHATHPGIFKFKPDYHKRTFGTKAQEHTPLNLYLENISGDETKEFMAERLSTLQSALTNSHLETRQVGSVEIDCSVTGGDKGALLFLRETFDLVMTLREDGMFPAQKPGELFLMNQYPGNIKFTVQSDGNFDLFERFYRDNSSFFSSCESILLDRGSHSFRDYTIDFSVSPDGGGHSSLKFGPIFTEAFESYIESSPPSYEEQKPLAAPATKNVDTQISFKTPSGKKTIPTGGVPVIPSKQGFDDPVSFVAGRIGMKTGSSKKEGPKGVVGKIVKKMDDESYVPSELGL